MIICLRILAVSIYLYNPNEFIDKNNTSRNPFFRKGMDLLKNSIEKHIQRIEHGLNTDLIEIHHLFYNEN